MSATPKVRDVVATALTDPGIVLDDVTVSVAGKRKLVRVTLDMLPTINADGSTDEPTPALSLDDVADLSRAISDALDRDEPFGGAAYVLEVSSPGVGRALREPRHYRRNVGRLLNVTMDIDLAALRALERERDLSLEVLIPAIETGSAHRLPPHRRVTSSSPASSWTARPAMSSSGPARGTPHCEPEAFDERARPTARRARPRVRRHPTGFGRVAAATARQVIVQRLRELEDDASSATSRAARATSSPASSSRAQTRARPGRLRHVEGMLPQAEQVPGETYKHGDRLRCYVVSVKRGPSGPQIGLSRTHPNLVRKLFALEVPEIADGTVEIAALIREAGHRTKIAVRSRVPGINAKGACIGPMGARVRAVMAELGGEKIDIVDFSEDPAEFVAAALVAGPGAVGRGRRPGLRARARVIVPDYQLSLAIGKEGQNARLAAKLTGWRIDIIRKRRGPGPYVCRVPATG
jgi:N utilization substance protein A